MTRFLRIAFLLITFFICEQTKASHLFGGEIYWRCLGNGQYVFHFDIYRDCSGVSFGYSQNDTEVLEILGTSRPRDINNNQINRITLKADWLRYLSLNYGEITPACLDSTGTSLSCTNNDVGATQILPFVSDPITLIGTPSVNGWIFKWDGFARPPTENVPQVALGLRSIMFPIKDPSGNPIYLPADSCLDSSPKFVEFPKTNICRDQEFSISAFALDEDYDSLAYDWDRPVDQNLNPIQNINGYSYFRPFPGPIHDSRNKYSNLDNRTGIYEQTVYSGSGNKVFIQLFELMLFERVKKLQVFGATFHLLFEIVPRLIRKPERKIVSQEF